MPTPQEPRKKKELASTYFVQDRQNEEELLRLTIQDKLVTRAMGGVLPEQPDATRFHRVLDVGCGIGGWVIEMAQTYPQMSLFGIDISARMIEYAREQAKAAGVADRVKFAVMDALMYLEFPPGHFDLVNQRFSISFVRRWDWPKLLQEMQRVTCRGGIVRLTDTQLLHPSSSLAYTRFYEEMLIPAFYQAGHLFESTPTGLTAHLGPLLTQHGYTSRQTKEYAVAIQAGTPEGLAYSEDMLHAFHTLPPFLKKWGHLREEYDAITKQALQDMQRPDFWATWNLFTAWATNPYPSQWPERD